MKLECVACANAPSHLDISTFVAIKKITKDGHLSTSEENFKEVIMHRIKEFSFLFFFVLIFKDLFI